MEASVLPVPDLLTDKPPRSRRWIPLSLRIFVVVNVAVAGVGLLWIGGMAYLHDATVRQVEKLGGWTNESPAPDWIAERWPLAARLFEDTHAVYLIADRSYDDIFWHNSRLATRSFVPASATFHAERIEDSQLADICRFKKLERLFLSGSEVSDTGMSSVAQLHDLAELSLAGSRVTDAGLMELSKLPELSYLSLEDTRITDAGLAHLARLPQLRFLLLDGTAVTDSGILQLADCPELHKISVRRTRVTESGAEALREASFRRKEAELLAAGVKIDEQGYLFLRYGKRVFVMQ